jgi:acetyl esterase/lipase
LIAGIAAALAVASAGPVRAGPATPAPEVIRLWPGPAPGTAEWSGNETETVDPANPFGPITVISNVATPTMTVFRPAAGTANGTAMVVLPGGGFQILAWDLEGTEVARFLTERGITAFVLKYRVRKPPAVPGAAPPATLEAMLRALAPARTLAIADAAQAMRLVRRDAARFDIRPDRVGMMGFSAGAITTVGLVLEGDASVRPDFVAPIYGTPMVADPVLPPGAPPAFIVSAQDDFLAAGSIATYELWTKAKRPAELHLFEVGGHGFGMRAKDKPVGRWPLAFERWLAAHGYLERSP